MRLLQYVNNVERLTMAEPVVAPQRNNIIPALIGAAVALGGTIYGGIQSAKANKRAEARQREMEAKENAWYNRRYNEDYADTAAGQNLVRRAKEYAKENWRKAAGAQAVAGGTDAATQMAKDAGNKMVGDTLANIAATDQMRKAQVDDAHRRSEGQFAQMDMAREVQRGQNIAQTASGLSNAAMSLGSSLSQTRSSNTNLQGGSNNSKDVTQIDAEMGVKPDYSPTDVVHFDGNSVIPAGDYTRAQLDRLIGG